MVLRLCFTVLLHICFIFISGISSVTITAKWDRAANDLQSGESVTLTCTVADYEANGLSVHLTCPLTSAGHYCMENCKKLCSTSGCMDVPLLNNIECSKESSGSTTEVYRYKLTNVDGRFTGSWSCRYMGTKSNEIAMKVTDNPVVTSLIAGKNAVLQGDLIQLTCTASSSGLSFNWTRSDKQTISHTITYPSQTTSVLTVTTAQPRDQGEYRCTVRNSRGLTATKTISITVNYPPSSVILRPNRASPVNAATTVSFSCDVTGGKPRATVRYYVQRRKTVSPVDISRHHSMANEDNKAKFFCRAFSTGIRFGSIKSPDVVYDVFFPPQSMELKASIAGTALREGAENTLTCQTIGESNPAPEVVWFGRPTGGGEVRISDGITRVTEGPKYGGKVLISQLTVVARRQLNKYTYKCAVYYQSQKKFVKNYVFHVTFPPNTHNLFAHPTNGLKEDETKILSCSSGSSSPPVSIIWTKQEPGKASTDVTLSAELKKELAAYGGFKVSSELKVTDTLRSRNGVVYECILKHQDFTKEVRYRHILNIYYPPDVTIEIYPLKVREGQTVTMTCTTQGGNPKSADGSYTYLWKFKKIYTVTAITLGSSEQKFVIQNVGPDNIGEYQCMVTNKGGTQRSTKTLTMEYSPILDSTRSTQLLVSKELHSSATLTVHIRANPPATSYQWFRLSISNGRLTRKLLSQTSKLKLSRSDNSFSLRVLGIAQSDYGEYECEIMNLIGRRKFKFTLTSPGPPATPTGLQLLNCTAVSCTLKWFSNFPGESQQRFALQFKLRAESSWPRVDQVTGLPDPGVRRPVQTTVNGLSSDADYLFRVRAENLNKSSDYTKTPVSGRTKVKPVIQQTSLSVKLKHNVAIITFRPPTSKTYTQMQVLTCSLQNQCFSQKLLPTEIKQGRTQVTLPSPKTSYRFRLIVKDGHMTVFETDKFQAHTDDPAASTTKMPMELVLGFIVGGAVVGLVILAGIIVLIILKCHWCRQSNAGKSGSSSSSQMSRRSPMTCGPRFTSCTSSMTTSQEGLVGLQTTSGSEGESSTSTPDALYLHAPGYGPPDVQRVHFNNHGDVSASTSSSGRPRLLSRGSLSPTGSVTCPEGADRPPDLVMGSDLYGQSNSRSSVSSIPSFNSRASLLSATPGSNSFNGVVLNGHQADHHATYVGRDPSYIELSGPHRSNKGYVNRLTVKNDPHYNYYQTSLPPPLETHLEALENYV